jgi:RHS repeat-associated protein
MHWGNRRRLRRCASGRSFAYNLRFPGQYYDAETGLNQNYFRDFDPSTGRYIESDPIGLKGGINTYSYVLDSPAMLSDKFGLSAGNCCQQTFGDCVQKCMQSRLKDVQSFVMDLAYLGLANSAALSPLDISGVPVSGPALQILSGLGGRQIGGAIGGAAGRGIGGGIGAFGGRLGIYGLAAAGSFLAGYGVGTTGYCLYVCSKDTCYY